MKPTDSGTSENFVTNLSDTTLAERQAGTITDIYCNTHNCISRLSNILSHIHSQPAGPFHALHLFIAVACTFVSSFGATSFDVLTRHPR